MSMRTSIVYGYGFEIEYISDGKIIDFIKLHKKAFCKSDEEKKLYKKLLKFIEDVDYLEDFLGNYRCDNSGHEGAGAVISNIISRETGIRFEYQCGDVDCNSYQSILFSERMPWNLNKKEKKLTIESLTEILVPYVEEFGMVRANIESLEVEYYG